MAAVELEQITKAYSNGLVALDSLDLSIADGEFMVLVGPSGCGKTTALRMVAGLEDISGGTLRIGNRVVNNISPKDRDIAMVFQNYGLYPHMTVADNIGFALTLKKLPKSEIAAKVTDAAKILGLSEHLNRKPGQLSGGQRQRVAMGRAIVREPAVFLMDEPLSNLDAQLRVQMRAEVIQIHRRLGVATLYVTHDQIEAMTMGDRVAVIKSGLLQQCAKPQVLYDDPANLFVASFIGSPSMNLYRAVLGEDGSSLRLGSQVIALSPEVHHHIGRLTQFRGRELIAGIRPENISLTEISDEMSVGGDVELVEALGSELFVHFRTDATRAETEALTSGERITSLELNDQARATAVGVARLAPDTKIRVGDRVRLRLDVSKMHFFDPVTGVSLSTAHA